MPRRVGILGGTFDPPHLGHVAIGVECAFRLGLDVVELVVANDPWQKSATRPITPAALRWEMTVAACLDHPSLAASDIELRRGGATYSIDTAEALVAAGDEVTLLLGDDAAARIETWHRASELAAIVQLGVVARPGLPPATTGDNWRMTRVDCPGFDVSSTDVRRRVASGAPIDHLVAASVRSVIERHGLYGFGR